VAIAVDDTTVPRFTDTPGNNTDITSASFTPPNASVLAVCVSTDTGSGSDVTVSVSDSQGLTWTNEVERDKGDVGAQDGHASIWTAVVATGASMTIGVQSPNIGGRRLSAKVYVVTGADTADPVGAVGEGSDTTNNITPTAYNSTVNNSRGIGCATDWNQLGLPTSTDTEDAADYAGAISVISLYKAADTPTSGTGVSMNFDGGGAGAAAWNWVAIEIKPAAGGGATINADARISIGSRQSGQSAVARVASSRIAAGSGARGSSAVSKVAQAVIAARSRLSGLASIMGLVFTDARLALRSSFRGLGAAARVTASRIAARSGLTGLFFQDTTPIAAKLSVRSVTRATIVNSPVTRAAIANAPVTRATIGEALATRAKVGAAPATRAKITVQKGG
jgi:hypothetical protein